MSQRAELMAGLEGEFGVLLHRLRRVVADRARAVHPDLTGASYLLLGHLLEHGPMRSSCLVETFGVDKGAVSRQVRQLLDLGLVERRPDPEDGRAQLFGNEGMLSAVTDDGIVYSLLFGEVTYESGIALTAGVADSSEGDKGVMEEGLEEEPAEEGDTSKKASRFMFVDVFYDPSLDTTLAGMSAPEAPPSEGAEGETGGEGAAEPAGGSSEPIDPEGPYGRRRAK